MGTMLPANGEDVAEHNRRNRPEMQFIAICTREAPPSGHLRDN